ncbi:MAG TPA: PASTA domain-containing protein [Lacipirellulaceae bacterium]|nr:PASTA domain-containing protein [Lacipirellulaceae bacterium]
MLNNRRFAAATAAWLALVAVGPAGADEGYPRVVGLSAHTAQQVADLAGCELVVGRYYLLPEQWRDSLRPGRLIMQTPQPQTPWAGDRTVAAWSFRKARPDQPVVEMPDLRGKTLAEARQLLRAAALQPMHARAADSDDDAAEQRPVDDHYPRRGQRVVAGSSVLLSLDATPADTP